MDSLAKRMVHDRTPEQRAALLVSAKILTEDGEYHPDYFPYTIERNKRLKNAELSSTTDQDTE